MILIDFKNSRESILEHLNKYEDEWIVEIEQFLETWWNKKDYFTSITSGSTGSPKEIKLQKKHAINSSKLTGDYFNFSSGQTCLLCMSTRYIGAKMMIIRADVYKMKLYAVEASKNPFSKIKEDIIFDFIPMLAIQAYNSLNIALFNKAKNILIGGSKLDYRLEKQLVESEVNFYSSYGMTETISHIAIRKIGEKSYSLLNGIEIDSDHNNCLNIKSKLLSNDLIQTNDIVEIMPGNKFKILGRLDNMIISGGVKLNPELIEDKLSNLIDSAFFISSLPDKELGEKLILLIEGNNTIDFDKISKSLGKFEKPKKIIYIKEFVRNENNKVIRTKTLDLIKSNMRY